MLAHTRNYFCVYKHLYSHTLSRRWAAAPPGEDNIVQKNTLRSLTRLPSVVTMGKTLPVWGEAYVQQWTAIGW